MFHHRLLRIFAVSLFLTALLTLQTEAAGPTAPTNGIIKFTRTALFGGEPNQYHSYHLRWKDNSTDEEGWQIQLRFASAGPFYHITDDRTGFLTAGVPDISQPDVEGYREAIVSVGGPPVGFIVQFRIVAWRISGSKTETSSLIIQTRVPASGGKASLALPSGLTAAIPANADGGIQLNWEDNSDAEAYYQLLVAEVLIPNVEPLPADYTTLGFLPFGSTSCIVGDEMTFPFNLTNQAVRKFVPGKTYRLALRVSGKDRSITPALVFRGTTSTPTDANTDAVKFPLFTMPSTLRAPTELTATAISEKDVLLRWNDNSDNESGYEIQSLNNSTATTIATIAANTTTINIDIGQLGTATFQVRAIYRVGDVKQAPSAVSAFASVTPSTTVFVSPTEVSAVTSGFARSVDLTWKDNTQTEYGFNVYCRPTSSSSVYAFCRAVPTNVTQVNVNSFTTADDAQGVPIFTPLAIGSSYDFIIRAVGDRESSISLDSNAAAATARDGFTNSRLDAPITQGVAFSFTLTTSGTRTNLTATGLPSGLSLNSSSGLIGGIPTQAGLFPVSLTASYSGSPNAAATLFLRVLAASSAPVVTSAVPNLTVGIGQPFIIPLSSRFSDADSEAAVRFETTKGNIDFLLYRSLAPQTVANFLAYASSGDYANVFFHRHVSGFVLQAGEFRTDNFIITKRPSPLNEPGISNLKWTLAAAKVGARDSVKTLTNLSTVLRDASFGYLGNPNSATTDFFINLNDNSGNLDEQNGGFTAYGRVTDASQAVVNTITSLPVGNFGGALSALPVDASSVPETVLLNQTVRINRVIPIPLLNYTTDDTSNTVASVAVEANQLRVTGLSPGQRVVTVTAKDQDGKSITQAFTISVDAAHQAPTITQQPISRIVAAGANTTMRVSATGSSLTYQWRRNEAPINGKITFELILMNVQAGDTGIYDVLVSNATTTLTSAPATLSLTTQPAITGTLTSRIIELGKPLEIQATITGAPTPACTWKRGTSTIQGQISSKLSLPAAKLSDAGIYTVSAKNSAGSSAPGSSGQATIIVIDKTTRYQSFKPQTRVKLTAPVAGPGLTFQWQKNNLDIPSNTPGFSGIQDATLNIASISGNDRGDYTCTITAPSGLGNAATGTFHLEVPSERPVLPIFSFPAASVGAGYRFTLPRDTAPGRAPASFSVKGLPSGLTCDANTGVISGIVRAVGSFSVSITASNPFGPSNAVKSELVVFPFSTGTAGSYVARVSASQALNVNLGGRLDLTLTTNSAFTATLQMAGETFRTAGNMTYVGNSFTSGAPVYQSNISFARKNRRALTATILITASSGEISGLITDGTSSAELLGYRRGWHSTYRSGPLLSSSLYAREVGSVKSASITYNAALDPEIARSNSSDTPQGSGYAALKVDNNGGASYVGRLADGTAVTSSTLVSASREMYFFKSLNLNTASIQGFVSLSGTRMNGTLRWIKSPQPISTRAYQPGFAPTTLSVAGQLYFPLSGKNALDLPNLTGNLKVALSQGGLPSSLDLLGALSPQNSLTAPANPANISLKITPSTGFFTGTFDSAGSKIIYQGLIIQAMNDTIPFNPPSGVGYFLRATQPTVTTSPQISGRVSLTTPLSITITTQPVSKIVNTGTNETFTTVATGPGTLTYQWYIGDVPITNAITASLIAGQSGKYFCTITSAGISVATNEVTLTVRVPVSAVTFTRTPDVNPIASGSTVKFSVTHAGSSAADDPTYQWLKDGFNIVGAIAASYTLPAVTSANNGIYSVTISNTLSGAAPYATEALGLSTLTVIDRVSNVSISRVPSSTTIVTSSSVTFTATASGAAPLSYRWLKNGIPLAPASASNTYTINTAALNDSGDYEVFVSNDITPSGVRSATNTLSVLQPVSNVVATRISPTSTTLPINTAVQLSVSSQGSATLSYQWRKGTVDISGANSSTYDFTTDGTASTSIYDVRVSNAASPSGVLSNGISIEVVDPTPP